MSDIKKTTRKLRNGPLIEVDVQILRWRQIMRKKEIALGKHMEKHRRKIKMQQEEAAVNTDEKLLKKKWF